MICCKEGVFKKRDVMCGSWVLGLGFRLGWIMGTMARGVKTSLRKERGHGMAWYYGVFPLLAYCQIEVSVCEGYLSVRFELWGAGGGS